MATTTTTAESDKPAPLTNEEIGRKLGLAHSTVSRMRRGQRVTSPSVMARMLEEFGVPPGKMLRAAASASQGDAGPWVDLMTETFGPLAE